MDTALEPRDAFNRYLDPHVPDCRADRLADAGGGCLGVTNWSMTADQVVAGSQGATRMMPPAKRYHSDVDNTEITVEATPASPMIFEIGFMFDTQGGGLRCVISNAVRDNAKALRVALMKRFGPPTKQSDFYGAKILKWETPDHVELVVNATPPTAAVTQCAPGRG